MKFGEKLKLLRKNKKISQEKLAERVGVSRQSISKWETGEAYPEMSNILALCTIFQCNINDLVNENLIDIDSLDDEVKMSVVKFKEKEQKQMKVMSKIIYVSARIGKVVSIIAVVGAILMLLFSVIVMPNVSFDTQNNIVTAFGESRYYVLTENELSLTSGSNIATFTADESIGVEQFTNKGHAYQVGFMVLLSLSLGVFGVCLNRTMHYLDKLFFNIHNEDTPFSMDNVKSIRMIAVFLAGAIIVPDVLGIFAQIIFKISLGVEINVMNYLFLVVIFTIAYIFKYGHEIQLDSKGRIYGDENE